MHLSFGGGEWDGQETTVTRRTLRRSCPGEGDLGFRTESVRRGKVGRAIELAGHTFSPSFSTKSEILFHVMGRGLGNSQIISFVFVLSSF